MERKRLLNYHTVRGIERRLSLLQATIKDFDAIEELLDAFGKPRDRVSALLKDYGFPSYKAYLKEVRQSEAGTRERLELIQITFQIRKYVEAMAHYFHEKENIKPEIWELKNSETV